MAEITESKNFIHAFIEEDIAPGGQFAGKTVHTRFPPEPNGYLHIGHCKALIIDFGTAEKFGGMCNLRMDDTNPTKEDVEFVEAIKEDIHWLGFDWGDRFFYGSDYFEKDYEYAVELIKKGLAYVCELTPEQFKEYRGDLNTPAVSPYRDRPIEESLDLFARMRAGEFEDNKYTLRAKIDLASGNFNMRDPVIYRIRHMHHHRQGDKWCIYPMYDFAHPIQDALEGITHSLCSLEFENHRPLYNWVVEHVSVPNHPRQIEFARLGIDHTVLSKRKLRALVENGYVSGWDDPRMPTLCGLRRRGYTPASIRNFCDRVGVAKSPNTIEFAFLEHCLREDLNETAKRVMTVLDPVKLTITNYPEGQSETFQVENNPNDAEAGTREISFSRDLWIERDDFLAQPIPKYKRLYPDGPECRLKGAYVIQCTGCVTDESGKVIEVLATYDPNSRGGDPADGRKIKGATIHWVDANNCVDCEVRQYSNLFDDPDPDAAGKDFLACLNPNSLEVLTHCKAEASLKNAKAPESYQFMRLGYFCPDSKDSAPEHLVFNRSVSLKDSFKPGK
ncbi:MAG: glutamine--tRNA ligase/YqeY domain fusion protein [Eubacteriales bacterium]|nr:glutamine--tRNA ligase/YqeY domain fusion protein [Clostridiales bacterium]MDD6371918.1 glutamine--tRNA ligase/YqeY domain fusion protein [Eubacteriales bacterium]MDY6067753.1 glutamine--tRNA ligase/YqeY domain fusion protein [Candidatus Faecousia sp.]